MPKRNISIRVAIEGPVSSMNAVDYAIKIAKKQDSAPSRTVLNILDTDTAKKTNVLFVYYCCTNLRFERIRKMGIAPNR